MRLFGMLLVLVAGAIAAPAQTNAPATAPINAPGTVRQLSLQDCIQEALRHNLDIQIDRFDPNIALFTLRADYGPYDPTFSLTGQHSHQESGTTLLVGGFPVSGSISDQNSLSSTLSGLLPWGTTYALGTTTPFSDTYGTTPTMLNTTTPASFSVQTQNVFTSTGIVPVPVFHTNFFQVPGRTSFESSQGAVGLTLNQPLLKNFWIDQTRLNIRVGKNRLKYSEQSLRLQIMTIINQLEQAYYDLIYDRENVVVQEKAVELAERLVVENRKKVEVGSIAPLDLQQAEAQAGTTRANLLDARRALAVQQNRIKQLITAQYSTWVDVAIEPTGTLGAPRQFFNLHNSWGKGLSLRPEIIQGRLDIERAGIQLKFDKNQLFPELDVFGTFGYGGFGTQFGDTLSDLSSTQHPFWIAGGRLSVPLTRTAARNTYKANKASMEQTVLNLKKVEESIMVAIDNDIRTAQFQFEQVAATRGAREYQEAALDAEQKKLESGKSTTYTVLQVQRDLTNARGQEISALAAYNKQLAQLSFDEGTTFERLRVNVEMK